MEHIRESIIIDAPIEQVWQTLMDFDAYPNWNPFITAIRGKAVKGGKLYVSIQPPNRKSMKFAPIVIQCDRPNEFRWLGKFLFKGLIDGEHYFLLEAVDENTTKLVQGEKFTGILVKPFRSMLSDTKKGFKAMNEALKLQCEVKHSNHQN